MRTISHAGVWALGWIAAASCAVAQSPVRRVPVPAPGRPGAVFLAGETVRVRVPAERGAALRSWRVSDDRGKVVKTGDRAPGADAVEPGRLGVGWYKVEFLDAKGRAAAWTTAAVLARLAAPTPADSPICADAASAWFSRRYRGRETAAQETFARLAAWAGVNWIRDRMSWGEIERQRGRFADRTLYDSSAAIQARAGLRVLQVFHSTPGWATDKTLDGPRAWKRFPRDLRVLYAFCRAMAVRFKGRVLAWEPWNEANIRSFGGHLIDEMCALQKAACLGFKAGEPNLTVCWNVFAGAGSRLHAEGVLANEAWPYFDTYNIHSYNRPKDYLELFAPARRAACGRPIWLTECGIRLRAQTKRPWGDLSPNDERRQAEFIARSYASSLYAGVSRHFFFILGNYVEGSTQFGLLRHDFTPRPGYAALAAVGRLLAGARPLGRLSPSVYAFRARPDGRERDVLVAWGQDEKQPLPADLPIERVFDYLGRPLGRSAPPRLASAPVFIVLPRGAARRLSLEPPPNAAGRREGPRSPIVFQVSLPASAARLGVQAYALEPGRTNDLPLFVYNFSDRAASGTVKIEQPPSAGAAELSAHSLTLPPMGRRRLLVRVSLPQAGRPLLEGSLVRVRGEFGAAGRPVIAFRIAADLAKLEPRFVRPLPGADRADRWENNIVGGATMTRAPARPAGVLFHMRFGDSDPWAYPRLRLSPTERPDDSFDGLRLTVQVLEGEGTVRVQFIEECGAAYVATLNVNPARRTPQRVVAFFKRSRWGSFSRRDPDGALQPRRIRAVLVGVNSRRRSEVKMLVRSLAWVRY